MAKKAVFGIATSMPQAERIANQLKAAGFSGNDISVLFPDKTGTRDFARYEAEGRILFRNYPDDWEKYTLAFPVTSMPNVTGAGLMRRYFQLLQFFRPEHIAELYWRTHDRVSPDAAWHTLLWNRVWTNYCLQRGLFRDSPLASTYPHEVPREIPTRPILALDPEAAATPCYGEGGV